MQVTILFLNQNAPINLAYTLSPVRLVPSTNPVFGKATLQ